MAYFCFPVLFHNCFQYQPLLEECVAHCIAVHLKYMHRERKKDYITTYSQRYGSKGFFLVNANTILNNIKYLVSGSEKR